MFRDELFKLPAGRTIEPVETAAGTTYVRSMMAGEKDKLDLAAAKDGLWRARIVQATCCDEAGRLEFAEGDIRRINDLPLHAIEPIVDASIKLNRIGPEDAETIRKNSPSGPNGDSCSASPVTSAAL